MKYIKGETKNISKIFEKKKNIKTIFHFGEFSRIYQSFINMKECINANIIGTNEVFNFCLNNKIKIIYSATSASFGNNGNDKNLSPYAFTKSKNLEMLENLKKWFKFKFEIVYFYNVYGPKQISTGQMATVIGIFENQFKNKKPLTVVRPDHNQGDLLILKTPLKFVIMLGKTINVDIIVFLVKKVLVFLLLLKCLNVKLNIYLLDQGRDMHLHSLT